MNKSEAITASSRPPALRRGVGFDAPSVRAGRPAVARIAASPSARSGRPGPGPGRRPCDGSRPTRGRSLPRRGPAGRRAWPETGRRRRPWRRWRGARPRLEELAEVDGQRGVVNRGGPAPGVQARQRAEVGPSGVDADRGVGEPARGRRGDGQRPRRVGASGERGRVGRCCLKHNGNYQSYEMASDPSEDLRNVGQLEIAQQIANHESARPARPGATHRSGDPAEGRRQRGLRRGRIPFSPYLESTHPAWVDRLPIMRRSTADIEVTVACSPTSDPQKRYPRRCRRRSRPTRPTSDPPRRMTWSPKTAGPGATGGETREESPEESPRSAVCALGTRPRSSGAARALGRGFNPSFPHQIEHQPTERQGHKNSKRHARVHF